jgi:hypothetical protein
LLHQNAGLFLADSPFIMNWLLRGLLMQEPSSGNPHIYVAIGGVAALLCFALLLTSSIWLTMAVMLLGFLHLAQYFPSAEAIIADDPVLLWLRRISPLIILGIFGIVLVGNWLF